VSSFLATRLGIAIVAFLVTALGVAAIVLLWEGVRGLGHAFRVRAQLERLRGRRADSSAKGPGLLRPERMQLEWLEPLLLRLPHRRDLEHLLQQADVDWGVGTLLLTSAGSGLALWVFTMVFSQDPRWSLFLGIVGALLPWLYLRRRKAKRLRAFEERFPDAIDLLGRSIRAGHAFQTGLQTIAEESPEPVSGEFRQVFEEQKFGLPLRESLMGLGDRVELVDVRMFITSVLIQRESGGNLAENLDNLSGIIRERFKFRRTLRTHTAQGRITGYVLAAAPIVAGLGMYMLNPEYEKLLFTEPLGRTMLVVAAIMQVIGFLIIRRIVDIEF
jgi:tight adherence protein B